MSTPGTFEAEPDLPRIPVPDLEESCAQFLEWARPLLTDEQYEATEAAVAEFLAVDSPAHPVYAAMKRHSELPEVHSWLDDFWRDRYLGRRVRTAINANFFFLLPDTDQHDQHERAAELVIAALDHKHAIDAETFPVTMQRGRPLSMEQHKYLFSSTRIPHPQRDLARTPYSQEWPGPSTARHIIVLVDAAMFRLEVIGSDGAPHAPSEIASALRAIDASVTTRGPGIGHLTSLDRADWAGVRDRLIGLDPANAAAMEEIERALFAIDLERRTPADLDAVCTELLAGDSGNRWFDKAVSFVVLPDGGAGLQGEHCRLDGTTVAELIVSMASATPAEHEQRCGARTQGTPPWQPVTFVVDDALQADIDRAATAFAEFSNVTVNRAVELDTIGIDRAKALGVSPDGFVQLAYQLAHLRAKGVIGATYESVATRTFHHGRTEAMRVITPQIQTFAALMQDPDADAGTRAEAIRAAAAAHVARARDCQAGRAPEQLLWELQLFDRRHGGDWSAALYDSPGWTIMRDDYLSTSSVPVQQVKMFGFGATSGRCIGIGYQLLPNSLTLYLSTPRAIADGMTAFIGELPGAIDDIAAALEASGSGG